MKNIIFIDPGGAKVKRKYWNSHQRKIKGNTYK
jgi:hypothetical protein